MGSEALHLWKHENVYNNNNTTGSVALQRKLIQHF